jgi:prepilin-type N-terminal cleavage/methylation domain-containing protein
VGSELNNPTALNSYNEKTRPLNSRSLNPTPPGTSKGRPQGVFRIKSPCGGFRGRVCRVREFKEPAIRGQAGFTFLELLVAISVAAIVVTLAFRFMQDTTLGIRMQGKRVNGAEKMMTAKKMIESVTNRMQAVISTNSSEVDFKMFGSDTVHEMVFKGDSLVVDNRSLCKGIRKINFELDDTKKGKSVLYWEGEMSSGNWIGGAVGFGREP